VDAVDAETQNRRLICKTKNLISRNFAKPSDGESVDLNAENAAEHI
jgi:hypothetical protein